MFHNENIKLYFFTIVPCHLETDSKYKWLNNSLALSGKYCELSPIWGIFWNWNTFWNLKTIREREKTQIICFKIKASNQTFEK